MKVSVVGLGKLGLPMATLFAKAGHDVFGIDVNQKLISTLNNGKCPYEEPGLNDLLSSVRIKFTNDFSVAASTDVCMIIVPTPSLENGTFSNEFILSAMESIGSKLEGKSYAPLIVICSTVMPTSTGTIIKNKLHEAAKREDINICYSPEFIALGSVIKDLSNPDLILIGSESLEIGQYLEGFLRSVSGDKAECHIMSLTEAEMTKISINTFITNKISFANTVGMIMDGLGYSSEKVLSAIGVDSRIGKKYLKYGPPFGGPCFPRDTHAFSALAKSRNVDPALANATDMVNSARLLSLVDSAVANDGPFGIVGLSYKPDTSVLDGAPGIMIARKIIERLDAKPLLWDSSALALDGAMKLFGNSALYFEDMKALIDNANVIIVTHDDENVRSLVRENNKVLIDCWN